MILVTGNGLLGSQFDDCIHLSSKSCDMRRQKKVEHWFEDYRPTHVIHTAAKVGGLGANMFNQAEFFYDNIMINTNIIEACRKYGVKRACFFLSTCVFPDKVEYPLTEEKIHLGPSHPSNYGYSEAKRAAEVMVRAYNKQYGLEYFCVIPCNVYGPNDNFSIDNGHVIPSLIRKCDLAKKNNTPLEIWGDGSPKREFIYSKDLAKYTKRILFDTNFTGNVIISNPEEYSIRQVVRNIVTLMDFKGEVIYKTDKPNGQLRKPSSIAKLESILEEQIVDEDGRCDGKMTNLWDGLEETIEWYYANYNRLRI